MRRIAFITESSTRQSEPMEAYIFYQGHRSRWVNSVIRYMMVRDFPWEDMFFLIQYEQRIIGFNEIVEPYPVQKFHPRKDASRHFAEKILAKVLSYSPLQFVEIHSGPTVADPYLLGTAAPEDEHSTSNPSEQQNIPTKNIVKQQLPP